jgi:hypothetical protein
MFSSALRWALFTRTTSGAAVSRKGLPEIFSSSGVAGDLNFPRRAPAMPASTSGLNARTTAQRM